MSKKQKQEYTGVFTGHAKGFGFVTVEGMDEDFYIPEDMTGGAFHQDTVGIVLLNAQGGKRQEARVVSVLKRGITRLVGTFERSGHNFAFVVPDNQKFSQDIFVSREYFANAENGQKVVVEILGYGTDTASPEGRVVEVLGHVGEPGVDILSIVRERGLPEVFPDKVTSQAQRIPQEISSADMAGRRDLRDTYMITIDGEDARDLDDAVNVWWDGSYFHLGVHIADVANYVQEGSALDREALERGTSVYLTDRVIPMLPTELSNGICSLNQGQDRLALSCLMTIDAYGEIIDHEICESVIRVDRRMSYGEVKSILESQEPEDCPPELLTMLRFMEEAAKALQAKRQKRGAIDFDFPECKIKLDDKGKPTEILPYERNVATRIIEDFMLAANETVALHFFWLDVPFLYRSHETPDADRIAVLVEFIYNMGYYIKALSKHSGKKKSKAPAFSGQIHPKEIQKLLKKIEGTAEESMISRLTLRSMKRARYSVESTGHFGLACQYYSHFTSPIRRYPDLQIHRIIKDYLRGRLNEERQDHYRQILEDVAARSSDRERRAEDAERETDKLKKAEYMSERVGETFEGVISGVTAWGVYVELSNTVEGLVHVSRLPGDYFIFKEASHEMVGKNTGFSYRMGMPVRIRVLGADLESRTVDFVMEEEEEAWPKKR